jgi:Flp pilus assembly protein TadD
MNRYLAVLFSDLVRHSDAWARTPRDTMVAVVGEYRYLAESLAGQYGCVYREWAGDGHMFLFENADAAVQFGLKLVESWRVARAELPTLRKVPQVPLRVGCHFGECSQIAEGEGWIGRGNAVAKRVETQAEPDTLLVTENVLDLLDVPLYETREVGERSLQGDHLAGRRLYHVTALHLDALQAKPAAELTAEDWFLRGVALVGTARENTEEEEQCYRDAVRLRPSYPEAHNNLAVVLRTRGDLAGAARHYQEALAARADYPEAHYNYAALLAARGSAAGSELHCREAIQLRADFVDAHHGLANLLKGLGRLEEAAEHYLRTLELRPDYAEAHNNYAVLLDGRGEPARADEHYREALRLRPDYPEAHYNLALLLDLRGDADEAERHYREALRLRPEYPEAQNNLAVLLQSRGELDEAERLYLAALDARPDDPEAHHNLGLLLRARGDEAGAERHLRTARELAPG